MGACTTGDDAAVERSPDDDGPADQAGADGSDPEAVGDDDRPSLECDGDLRESKVLDFVDLEEGEPGGPLEVAREGRGTGGLVRGSDELIRIHSRKVALERDGALVAFIELVATEDGNHRISGYDACKEATR